MQNYKKISLWILQLLNIVIFLNKKQKKFSEIIMTIKFTFYLIILVLGL